MPRHHKASSVFAAVLISLLVGCGAAGAPTTSAPRSPDVQASAVATPSETEPAPTTTEPAPASSSPAPASAKPAAADTKPAVTKPAVTKPVDTEPADTKPAPNEPAGASASLAATATQSRVEVYSAPDGAVSQSFDNPQASGAPLTFAVERQDGKWLKVRLPARPNGSTGWVRAGDVTVTRVPYRIEISTGAHELRVYKSGELLHTFPAATGTGGTPTPRGEFYLTELLAPTNSGYGPYAYGVSAFSEVLNSFGGGPGQIGIHGTADADSIGRSSSHGCVRLSNANITTLAKMLPLGTPVVIS